MIVRFNGRTLFFYLFMAVYVFLYLFYPPLIKINLEYILAAAAWVYALATFRDFFRWLQTELVRRVFEFTFFSTLIMLAVSTANGISIVENVYIFGYWILLYGPICYFVCRALLKMGADSRSFFNLLCVVCNLQGICAVVSFLSPAFHSWVLGRFIHYGYDADRYSKLANYRLYGLAFHLTNFAPVVSAVMIVLCVHYAKKDLKYLLYTPLMFFAVFLNSRTSIVFVLAGLVLVLLRSLNDPGRFLKYLLIFLLIALAAFAGIRLVFSNAGSWYSGWMRVGYNAVLALFRGDASQSYFGYLFNGKNWRVPDDVVHLLIGYGTTTSTDVFGFATDVGYVNYIWKGGVVYLIAIFYMFFYAIRKTFWEREDRTVFYVLTLLTLVLNIKDIAFSVNEYMCFMFLICSYSWMERCAEEDDLE